MTVKLGVIGTNFVSDWLCEAVSLTADICVDAVYSRQEKTGRSFAEKHKIPHVFTHMDDFLSSGIDAVYIASPTYCHFEQAMQAMETGLHVLCEKPLVMRKAEYMTLKEKAEEKGVVWMEAMRPAHDPAFSTVQKALEKVGKVRRVSFEYCQYSSRYDRFLTGEVLNAFDPAVSGGAVYDIGIYPLFWCTALFGKPKTVAASSTFLENGFEGGGSILLGYEGFEATVTYSKICDSVIPSVITGEKGSLVIHKMQAPERIVFYPRKGEGMMLDYTPVPNNLVYEVADFLSLIRKGEKDSFAAYSQVLYETLDRVTDAAGIGNT